MRTPPTRGRAADGIDEDAWTGTPLDTLPRRRPQAPARRPCRPEAAQARLHTQTEHLVWGAYLRALRLQRAEPGPETAIIRGAVFKVWEQAFLAGDVAP